MTVARVIPARKQSAIGVWIVPSSDEKDVGAGAFGDPALPVHHQGVGVAAPLRAMLGDGADHVEAGGLGERRRGRGIRAPIVGDIEPDALHPLRRIEIARPVPDGDAQVNGVVLRRDAHHLRSPPRDRAHIGVGEIVAPQRLGFGRVDLVDRPGNFKIENAGRVFQPARVLGRLENAAAVGALAFENRARIMQRVGQHVDLGVAPFDHPAVQPDPSVTIVEIRRGHRAFLRSGHKLVWFLVFWVYMQGVEPSPT